MNVCMPEHVIGKCQVLSDENLVYRAKDFHTEILLLALLSIQE